MQPLVSVIIPAYNADRTIGRCIKSVLAQTLSDIEIIVSDDGSKDNTAAEALENGEGRVKIIFSQDNTGQGFARNRGIEAASGEYIAFVDADDTIEPQMLEKMCARAKSTGADVVQCNIRDFFGNGSQKIQLPPLDKTVEVGDRADYCVKYFASCRHSYEVCNKLIRREFIAENNLYFGDTKTYFSEDLMFNIDMLRCLGKISFIPDAYYNYYIGRDGHFNSGGGKRPDGLCALFRRAVSDADACMKDALSLTAAMVLIYTAGRSVTADAQRVLMDAETEGYIRAGLRCKCGAKRKLFLRVMLASPVKVRCYLAEWYGRR